MRFICSSLIAFFVLSFSCLVTAAEEINSISDTQPKTENLGKWSVEAQLNTYSISVSPTFGPTLNYSLNEKNLLGLRTLAPLSREATTETFSAHLVWRHMFSQKKTSLFSELTTGYLLTLNQGVEGPGYLQAGAAGFNLGAQYKLDSNFGIGGLAGGDFTRLEVTRRSFAILSEGPVIFYPRLALFANVIF